MSSTPLMLDLALPVSGARGTPTIAAHVWKLFGASVVLVALLGAALYWNLSRLADLRTATRQTLEIQSSLRALGEDVAQAESGQRGYLLTTDPAYLAPYEAGTHKARARLASLEAAALDAPARTPLDQLKPLVDAKLSELAEAIAMARGGHRDAALRMVAEGRGKALMDQILVLRDRLLDIESGLRDERRARVDANLVRTTWILLLGSTALIGLLFLYTRSATRRLGRPVEELIARIRALTDAAAGGPRVLPPRDEIAWISQEFNETVARLKAANEERRRLERDLELARDHYQSLYESTPAMLQSIDAAGRIVSVSDTWLAKLGYQRAAVLGKPSGSFLAPESRDRSRDVVLPELFRLGRCDNVHFQLVRADDSLLDVLLSAVVQRDGSGHAIRSLVVMEDISETLAHSAALRKEHALRLELEERAGELKALLSERNEMLYVLAHEVRQPLNNASAVLQNAGMMLAEKGQARQAERIQQAQGLMTSVLADIDNTLAVASLVAVDGPPQRIDTDIDTLVDITIGDMPHADRPRVRVLRDTPTRTASMDPGLMRLALRNLLANALRYSPRTAPVSLTIADSDDPLALVFEVLDEGEGIAPNLVPGLFERGTQGLRSRHEPGHGLGLYIVRRIMEIHGGRVDLVRTGPTGTLMRVILPQAAGD